MFLLCMLLSFFFFFSSRRRHTRLVSDWSSDVCSSDLGATWLLRGVPMVVSTYGYDVGRLCRDACWIERYRWAAERGATRSEERRVGKECRARGAPDH